MGTSDSNSRGMNGPVGTGLVYAWMWVTFWTPIVSGDALLGATGAVALLLAFRIAKLLAFACFPRFKPNWPLHGPVVGTLGTVGTLLMAAAPYFPAPGFLPLVLQCVGAALVAISVAAFIVAWNSVYAGLEYGDILKSVAIFVGLGAAALLLLSALGRPLGTAVSCSLPAVSSYILSKSGGIRQEHNHQDSEGGLGDVFPKGVLLVALLIAFANGYIRGMGLSVVSSSGGPQATVLFTSIAVAAFFMYTANSLAVIYTGSFLLVSAGLLLEAFTQGAGTTFIGLSFICFESAMWVLVSATVKKQGADPMVVCSRVWLVLETGMLAGTLFGIAMGTLPPVILAGVPFSNASLAALAYAILAILTVTSARPYLSIIEDEVQAIREKGEYQELVEKAAKRHDLTTREAEVLGLLAYGRDARYIEKALVVSHNTVKTHLKHIYTKFGVSSRQELLDMISEEG